MAHLSTCMRLYKGRFWSSDPLLEGKHVVSCFHSSGRGKKGDLRSYFRIQGAT